MFTDLISDGFFAAIAAIGFGCISNIPVKAFYGCAWLAALGHSTRFLLMTAAGCNIIAATFVGAVVTGLLAVPAGRYHSSPAESLAFPALLPMIPGMYAYRCVEGILQCIVNSGEPGFHHAFYLFAYNGMMCTIIIMAMVIGITIPVMVQHRYMARAGKKEKQ